jgi:hypothetical protein
MNEMIAAAAVRVGERIFTGATHFDATRKLMMLPQLNAEEKTRMMLAGEAGFVTDAGRFVNAEAGHAIAREAGQLRHDPDSVRESKLLAEQLEFYGAMPVDKKIF